MEEIARKRFELENNIKEENLEEIYKYDEETYTDLLREQPWLRELVPTIKKEIRKKEK